MSTTSDIDIGVHHEISNKYLRIKTINITPVASSWRKRKTIKSLLILLLFILIIYVVCFSLYLHQMIMLYNKINIQSSTENDQKAFQILKHILSKPDDCYHCIYNYTTNEDIEQILNAHDNAIDQKTELDYLHLVLNIIASFNVLLGFAVYGGPFVITTQVKHS